jgi:hypothetical protein
MLLHTSLLTVLKIGDGGSSKGSEGVKITGNWIIGALVMAGIRRLVPCQHFSMYS